ncbi:MAG: hypothetical protein JO278_04185, partial [Dyella sp.]|nr:hypothetical protein [Dyella sp.]
MNTQGITRQLLAAAIFTALAVGATHAQDAAPQSQNQGPAPAAPADQKSAKTLDQVVVTGTSAAGGLKKIDAS